MKTIFEDALNLPSRHSPSVFVPIYKLDLKTGEIELLLSEAGVRSDANKKYIYLPNDASYKNFNDNRDTYFWVFSKKYAYKNYFRREYLNEIIKIEPSNILNKLGYMCFCFKEDFDNFADNHMPLYFKEELKKMSDEKRNDPIWCIYLDLGGNDYIKESKKEDEWIKADSVIKNYTDHYVKYQRINNQLSNDKEYRYEFIQRYGYSYNNPIILEHMVDNPLEIYKELEEIMNKYVVKLNYYQIMIFLYGIKKIKEENNNIDEEMVSIFSKSSINAIGEIVTSAYGMLPTKILKNMKLYQVPKTMYDYLVEITSINPIDTKDYKYYKIIIEKIDEQVNNLLNEQLDEIQQSIEKKYNVKNKSKSKLKK